MRRRPAMGGFTPRQRRNQQRLQQVADEQHASPRERKALIESASVESNYEDLQGGDRDSTGILQQRPSQGWGPVGEGVETDARQFLRAARRANTGGGSAGQLAQRVQRSEFPGRYDQRSAEAEGILRSNGLQVGSRSTPQPTPQPAPAQRVELRQQATFDQQGFDQAQQRARVGQFLAKRHGTSGVLFRTGLLNTTMPDRSDFTGSKLTSRVVTDRSRPPAGAAVLATGDVNRAVREASKRLGVREVANNRGKRIDRWESKFGMVGQPWCGIFLGTALRRAGVHGVTSRVASVQAIEEDAKAGTNGFDSWHSAKDAQPGDALVTRRGQHVGIVESVDRKRGVIHTIEGNTGTGAVERRTHPVGSVYGAARPRYRR